MSTVILTGVFAHHKTGWHRSCWFVCWGSSCSWSHSAKTTMA